MWRLYPTRITTRSSGQRIPHMDEIDDWSTVESQSQSDTDSEIQFKATDYVGYANSHNNAQVTALKPACPGASAGFPIPKSNVSGANALG